MAFRAAVDILTERQIDDLVTPRIYAQMLADYANDNARQAQRTNEQALGRAVTYLTLINGTPRPITAEAILAEKAGHIEIEYDFNLGLMGVAQGALNAVAALRATLAGRFLVRGMIHGTMDLFKSDGSVDEEVERAIVLTWIMEQLVAAAPVLTGAYRDALVLYADGVESEPSDASVDTKEFIFMNTTPYSNKIEHGESDQAPDGVFEGVAALADEQFGELADIGFMYLDRPGGSGAAGERGPCISVEFK
ncbi:MAG: hypothetical protein HXX10_07690 [Rhodoplanes sp.]|uniref:hypothetical protein n=1 Tax=Rhodoplanes sp. TaxID=1968906 RepID=UPI00181CD340|nr:hypothetical protein [Rhodoplanes sp.]NVO13903.1 hypothetical protein [Rhodoplanes sp.]